jgi:hypothetical protein
MADVVLGLDLDKNRETMDELNQLFVVWFKGLFMPAIKMPLPGNPFVATQKARAQKARGQIKTILWRRTPKAASFGATTREKQLDIMGILLVPTKDDAGHEIQLDNDGMFDDLVRLLGNVCLRHGVGAQGSLR